MSVQSFRFRYTLFTVEARLSEGVLSARMGVRMVVVSVADVQHLWVGAGGDGDHRELVLSYRGRGGRLKRARLYADRGAPGFEALVEALLALRPEADIRSLPAREAYERMGSRNLEWVALPVVGVLGVVLLTGLFAPLLGHGLDRGSASLPVEALGSPGPLPTRNLELVGQARLELAARGPVSDKTGAPQHLWVPLVPAGWTTERPVAVVMQVNLASGEDPAVALAGDRHRGVVRDLLWESVPHEARRDLVASGLNLAPHVRLFERGADARAELLLALTILGMMGALVAILALVLRGRRPSR